MNEETLKRAAAGDPGAIRELKRWAVGSTDLQELNRLIKILEDSKKEKGEAQFWSDLLDLKNAIDTRPRSTAEELDRMEDRARALGSCEVVQVLGLRAARWALLGDFRAAEDTLREAWAAAPSCRLARSPDLSPCLAYLHRRQGLLDLALGRPESALARVQRSLDCFRRLGAGHDLNGDGEGSSLFARAEILFELGDHEGSLADLSACLDRFPTTSAIWPKAHQNFAAVLSKTGEEGRKRGHAMLERQRLVMRRRQDTLLGAAFWWVDGQLSHALGIRRDRAIRKMRKALDFFASEGMRDHYKGVALDIARAYYPRRDQILDFLDETKRIRESLLRGERDEEMFEEIYDLVDGCPDLSTLSRLDAVLRQWRDALTGQASLPPCLLNASA